MAVLQKLRMETSASHSAIEANPLLKRLTENLSLAEYIHILEKFYGVYLSFENSLNWEEIESLTEMKFTGDRRKTPLLEKDLRYFDVSLNQIPLPSPSRSTLSFSALLGCLYVFEGSCLGRKMMWPKLSAALGLNENQGGAFFYDCGDKIPANWKKFCEMLNSQINTAAQEQECIHAAIQTFENIDQWFKEKHIG